MRWLAAAAVAAAFLAVSAGIARVIAAGSAARDAATDAVKPGAGGDVEILRVDGISGFALTGRTETARVAWRSGGRLPVVQCVRVRRTGDPLAGYETSVQSVSHPIDREADCPG